MQRRNKKILSLIITTSVLSSLLVTTPIITKAESTNIALNKPATASSYIGGNTPNAAFDQDTDNTRFESEYSDSQWIAVDLGSNYSITGVKLKWETAAGKDYIIQVSEDNANWTDAYTKQNGTGGTDDITFDKPATGRYVRMYGISRTTGYGYSLWNFEVFGSKTSNNVETKVATPAITPSTGTYDSAKTVTIQAPTTDSVIRYTTDGTDPTATTGTVYTGPFTVSDSKTIKAIATKEGMTNSDVAASTITISKSQSSNENLALNKPATASSYIGGNTPAAAFDGDANNTRFESEYSASQWISVDLGSDYNVTGVELKWETAAGKEYNIQVSKDGTNWVNAYTKTNGTGGTDNITFDAPVSGRYVRMYGISRTTGYGYSLWDFKVFGTQNDSETPGTPTGLAITSTANSSIGLNWNAVTGATGYNIYRSNSSDGTYAKLNTSPVSETVYTDMGLTNGTYYYKVSAVNSSGESSLSSPIEATATSVVDFGSNVKIFDPSMSSASIQSSIDEIYSEMEDNQFGSERYAMLFKPGSYNNDVKVGFFTSVIGLGQVPDAVNITGAVRSEADWMNGNATCNFWRSAENFAINPTVVSNNVTSTGTLTWAVSQAAPMRRVHVKGNLSLWDPLGTNYDGAWSSGGFIADSKIDGTITSASQQQFFTRNSKMSSWDGQNWNMVFVGNEGAPTNDSAYPASANTVIGESPITREKPFLNIDNNGNYSVFVPGVKHNTKGVSWEHGIGEGTSLSIDQFVIAKPETATAQSLNQALSQGKNIIFTPGIYNLSEALNVTKPNTVIMGLGFATLSPVNGTAAIKVADVDGVNISGLLFEAGTENSPQLLEVGEPGSSKDHSSNPITLSDLVFRVGGQDVGKADACMVINSDDVIGDQFWVWRADHGNGVGWDVNVCNNGVIVNGDDVTIYGLFVEHFNQYQTIWNGNGGKVYFYQSEIPYDVPNQSAWMSHDGTVNGYASYKVADSVTSHELYGAGVYSFFRDAVIAANSAIEVPNNLGVKVHHACSVFLAGNGEITHVVNNTGNVAKSGNMRQTVTDYGNTTEQPTITPKSLVSAVAQTVNITSVTPGSTIRYTTDGSEPTTTNGTIYTGAFTVSTTTTIKAIAYKSGMANSGVAVSTIAIKPDYANDLALGKTAIASSGPANLAFDGDTTTRWASDWNDDQWISVDLGASYTLTGAKLSWEAAAAKDYKIQVSNDNINWVDAYTKTNGKGGTENITFNTPVSGRYVKMKGISRTTEWGYSLWEFEVYGNK